MQMGKGRSGSCKSKAHRQVTAHSKSKETKPSSHCCVKQEHQLEMERGLHWASCGADETRVNPAFPTLGCPYIGGSDNRTDVRRAGFAQAQKLGFLGPKHVYAGLRHPFGCL